MSDRHLNNVLVHAEDEAKQMGDEYVSVEHLFLAMLKYAGRDDEEYLQGVWNQSRWIFTGTFHCAAGISE